MAKSLFLMGCALTFMIDLFGQIPNDAQHPFAQILYSTTPAGNQYGVAWFQTVTLQNNHIPNTGYISVDYIKLIEEDISTGNDTVLHIENYNGSGALTLNEGGLYERFPTWYNNGTYIAMTNSNSSNGFLTINVGQQPDKVNHFWGVRQFCALGKRHKVEIRVLISGDVALQAGMDYWTNSFSTSQGDDLEAFYSNWYGDSGGQYITINYPNYGPQNMFDRTDYGFNQNGRFYLSKSLVEFVGGTSVALNADVTNWQPVSMTLNGNMYEYFTGSSLSNAHYYCYHITQGGIGVYVPHAILNNLVYPNDAVGNGFGGYNFYTSAQPLAAVNILLQNVTVSTGQLKCYGATQSIATAGNGSTFIIHPGGSATFIAGQHISLLPGTSVQSGGYLHGYIAPSGPFCSTGSSPQSSFQHFSQNDFFKPEAIEMTSVTGKFFAIYPNPTSGEFYLEFNEPEEFQSGRLDVFGTLGEPIHAQILNGNCTYELNLANEPAGIYIIRIITGKKAETARLLKQ